MSWFLRSAEPSEAYQSLHAEIMRDQGVEETVRFETFKIEIDGLFDEMSSGDSFDTLVDDFISEAQTEIDHTIEEIWNDLVLEDVTVDEHFMMLYRDLAEDANQEPPERVNWQKEGF